MSKTGCLTYYYSEFWGTDEFLKSCKEVDIPVYNCWPKNTPFCGHGETVRFMHEGLLELKRQGYDKVIYADAADSYFVKAFEPPDGIILYSTEKAYYPECIGNFKHRYPQDTVRPDDQWKYLNAGGWCGDIDQVLELWELAGFYKHRGDINGQHECHKMFWEGVDAGIPVKFDTECKYFQTGAFEHMEDFSIITEYKDGEFGRAYVKNNHTGTVPCLWHFNGRTDAKWFYDLYK